MQRTTVIGVTDYAYTSDSVTLDCRIDDEFSATDWKYREDADVGGRTVPVTLEFYNSSTFRFEFQANTEAGSTETLNDLDEAVIRDDVDLDVTETEGQLRVETSALRVAVGLDEWSFAVTEPDGTVLFEEQREDIDVRGDLRVEPLGFSEVVADTGPDKVATTGTAFDLVPDEGVYGLGEKFVEFDKRGREITSWTVEPYGTETENSYKNVPFHLSTRGYGLLVDTTNRVEYDLGKTTTASATINVHDDTFAFVFFYGPSFKEILREYTALSGRVDMPPKWSFGVWMSRLGYESRKHLEEITAELRDREVPCDVVHLDPFWMRDFRSCDLKWDTDQFPDPEGMIEELHEDGFHLSLWEHPYVPVGSTAFKEGREGGYFVTDGTGSPYVMNNLCQGDYRGAIVDFTDPDAVEWWKDKHRRLVKMGVDVFKTDYGEGIPADAAFANGLTGKSMHNFYPFLYNETVYEAIVDVNGRDEALVWGRSAWIGNQRFPMYWGGDAQTSFSGMASALRGGLSLSLSGFPFWSHDIGGFRGTPSEEVYVRWSQFGLLSSHARCHGTTPREPWAFGEEAVRIFKKFAQLRYRLLSYLYSYAAAARETGLPVVRPLVLEYQNDPSVSDVDLQYLLGEELLVAPVFDESGRVDIYFPDGDDWVDYWTGERYDGGQTLRREVPLDRMPLFVRAESVLPLHESSQTVEEGTPDEVTLRVTPATRGDTQTSFNFYDEDRGEFVDVGCSILKGEIDIAIDSGERTGIFQVEIVDVEHVPDAVRANGTNCEHVDEAPGEGEWTYDAEAETVHVNLR